MITKQEILEIGKFLKTHALRGELNAMLDVDIDYAEEDHPLIVEIDGIFVPFYIESIRTKGAETFLIKLKGVDNQEEAQSFVNRLIYGLRKDVEEYFGDEDLELASDFVGYELIDEEFGPIGKIEGIEDSTSNVLFIVRTLAEEEIFIPVADEFIVGIDDENKIIRTELPSGLLDINNK
ncbi:MAG: 16S rRNA processing protein RimM [Bacteroidales bacterium]|nr:16S rRNA processing protein RimM [Bacteroidales bacterium]MBD5223045.1 16S rRNA processing protein RimM [Bacteroidales bacterium]MBD5301853.1 16S rRNA processing protein RimM [Bacteroides sp.]